MKTLVSYGIWLMIGTISLTNFVFATGETAPSATVACPACSSGSPEMKDYITWMSELLTILWWVNNEDPGAIPWQQVNIDRYKSQADAWANYLSNNDTITISQQARGVKSDLNSLNKLRDRISSTAIVLIGKAQWREQVDSSVLASMRSKIWTSKLLSGTWSISTSTTYQDLSTSLIQLHNQVANLTLWQSWSTILWQWYQWDTTAVNKLTTYYSCAQTIPACSNQAAAINDMSASVRWYWGDILRAGQQISEVFSAQYRDTWPWTKKIIFGDGFGQAREETKEIGWSIRWAAKWIWNASSLTAKTLWDIRPWWGNWKEFASNIRVKREARQAQKKQQKELEDSIAKTQEAIKKWWAVGVAPTQTQVQWVVNQASYNTQDISYLAQLLNASNDRLLEERIATEKYTVVSDSRIITYMIPQLTRQIYDTQQALKQSATIVYQQCELHCSNETQKFCGSPSV